MIKGMVVKQGLMERMRTPGFIVGVFIKASGIQAASRSGNLSHTARIGGTHPA
jgi:hypothetical protein